MGSEINMTFTLQVTFSEKTRKVAQDLGLEDPAVVQGMYIFKQPKIGTEGGQHKWIINWNQLDIIG